MPIKIVLADDHSMFREMLRYGLHYKGDKYVIMAEAADGPDTFALVSRYGPDLLLLDVKMPGVGRLSTFVKEVARRSAATRILVLSGHLEEEVVLEAAVGGAHGYVLKGAPFSDLLSAIETLVAGGIWVDPQLPSQVVKAFLHYRVKKPSKLEKLSRQELRILSFLAQGLSNREITSHVHITQKTVKNHVTHVLAKLGVSNRRQATSVFLSN